MPEHVPPVLQSPHGLVLDVVSLSVVTIALRHKPYRFQGLILIDSVLMPWVSSTRDQSTNSRNLSLISHLCSFCNFSLRDKVKLQEKPALTQKCLETHLHIFL